MLFYILWWGRLSYLISSVTAERRKIALPTDFAQNVIAHHSKQRFPVSIRIMDDADMGTPGQALKASSGATTLTDQT